MLGAGMSEIASLTLAMTADGFVIARPPQADVAISNATQGYIKERRRNTE
jgi:type IV secretory pathway protease TraF